MTKVRIKNHSEAVQGFYEERAPVEGVDTGSFPVHVAPGATSRVLDISDFQLAHARQHMAHLVTITEVSDEEAAREATAAPAPPPEAGSAGEPDSAAKSVAPVDEFSEMTDEELRAFVTDLGGKPHHNLGRARLAQMAVDLQSGRLQPADGAAEEPAATVGDEAEAV